MNRATQWALCTAAIPVAILAAAVAAEELELSRWTIDGGGVMHSVGGELELSGTIAQPDAGVMYGGNVELTGGFWFSLALGDCNSDGGVNLLDYSDWSACLSGPNGRPPIGCACFDLDQDGDIDLSDAAELQISFAGK